MNVLFIASETVPFAKTGGLADVVSALSSHLHNTGHNVRVIIPYYSSIREKGIETTEVLGSMCVHMAPGVEEWCSIHEAKGTGGVTVWLIEHNGFYNRDGIYNDKDFNDYWDNSSRFGFLARAALQTAIDTKFSPDIIHLHDWQAALAAPYQKLWFWDNPIIGNAATVLTIHNAMYQGVYGGEKYEYLGFGWEHFTSDTFEDHGRLNMLKSGIHYSDVINTVSPTHAKEIAAEYSEFGIDHYLNKKGENFKGILNGIDYDEWCPESDTLIPANFSSKDLSGKGICKKELQASFGLDDRPDVPVIGIVGRLVEQKGYQLLTPVLEHILGTMDVQFAFVGSGDKGLEHFLSEMAGKYPGKFGCWIGYSNTKAHLVEAGSDMFLMPSLFEPCGLNQIYSLKYGTLPIVRSVGGLADTVENYNPSTGEGTGFVFDHATPNALLGTIGWAVDTWFNKPEHFSKLRQKAMKQEFTWDRSGAEYLAYYKQALIVRKAYNRTF
jgi:starch synthase